MEDTKQFMEENDVLKQFMELLSQQNMGGQLQDFMELFKYAAGMQLQLAVMADELQGVRQQLSQLLEKQAKSVKENLTKALPIRCASTSVSTHRTILSGISPDGAAEGI